MIVNLKNKAGEICTLAQWCGESPSVEIYVDRFSEVDTEGDLKKLAELRKIAEVATEFYLWMSSSGVDGKKVSFHIHPSGEIAVCCSAQPGDVDRIKKAVVQAETIVENNAWRKLGWDCTGYEVPYPPERYFKGVGSSCAEQGE
jgi:hypothetical protein